MRRLTSVLVGALMLSGCFHVRLERPDVPVIAHAPARTPSPSTVCVNYQLKGESSTASRALRDSLAAFGIQDVEGSEAISEGCITLLVYLLPARSGTIDRYIGIPWGMVSFATLGLIPLHFTHISPVEIHVIDPAAGAGEKIQVICSEFETKNWMWLPFLFKSGVSAAGDVAYGTGETLFQVHTTAWRRIFDPVVADILRTRQAASTTTVNHK